MSKFLVAALFAVALIIVGCSESNINEPVFSGTTTSLGKPGPEPDQKVVSLVGIVSYGSGDWSDIQYQVSGLASYRFDRVPDAEQPTFAVTLSTEVALRPLGSQSDMATFGGTSIDYIGDSDIMPISFTRSYSAEPSVNNTILFVTFEASKEELVVKKMWLQFDDGNE